MQILPLKTKLQVYWPKEKDYFPGVVSSHKNNREQITYDDGDSGDLQKDSEGKWYVVESAQLDSPERPLPIGTKLAIYWNLERRCFPGVVESITNGRESIRYDDGDVGDLDKDSGGRWYFEGHQNLVTANTSGLKLLTINMCVAVSGLHNHILPKLCTLGGNTLGFSVLFALVAGTFIKTNDLRSTVLLSLFLYAPFVVVLGFSLGSQMGRIAGMIFYLVTGHHDYKRERILEMVEVMAQYDVVLIQELYDGAPAFLDPGYPEFVVENMARAGFAYVARPAGRSFPSICMGSGLMILSRYPIEDHKTLSFNSQFFGESFGTNRGAMHARLRVPGGAVGGAGSSPDESVDVFTCHLTASMREALMKGGPEVLLSMADKARLDQFDEMRAFIDERRSGGTDSICAVAGDFNANIKHTNGEIIEGEAIKAVTKNMIDKLKFKEMLPRKVSYGYIPRDDLLTNKNHAKNNQVTEDLIFVDPKTTLGSEFESVPLLSSGHYGYGHLSDHLALRVSLKVSTGGWQNGSRSPAKNGNGRSRSKTPTRRSKTPEGSRVIARKRNFR